MAEPLTPDQDPVVTRSYALYYLVAILLLVGSLFWALWDEDYGQRPWKKYQEEFRQRYSAFLKGARSQSVQSEKDVESDAEYRKLADAADAADKQASPAMKQINEKLKAVSANLLAVQNVFTDRRAWVNAKVYEMETTDSASSKASKQRQLDKYKAEQSTVKFPDGSRKDFNFDQLEEEYNRLREEKAKLNADLGDLLKPVTEARTKRDDYLKEHLVSLTPEQIAGLQKKTAEWDSKIVQINVASANIVDRCESCHMAIREPVKLTAASMSVKGSKPDEYARALTSHPDEELLKIHDPEKFGCSPCHQGNGRATTSVVKGHGDYEHWLWPLFQKQNVEAGCQTCHAADMMLHLTTGNVGQVISEGKFLFRQRGCNGCHRYEGYDREPEDLLNVQQQIKQKEEEQAANLRTAAMVTKQADNASDNATANRLYAEAEALKVANSRIAGQIEQLDFHSRDLLRDEKKIGPDLKEVRTKLNKNWIPVWLHKPTDFRPTTKMPNFRLNDEQIKAISAYLWQTALTDKLPTAPKGDAGRGKDLFETRGCMGCHSIGEGSEMQGGDFAANLTRVGEKVNYDYLVRWIKNPRTRTRPYCPYEKKDIGPEDYAKHNLPYQFDFEHSTCPNDGHELQVEQMTVMPSLRLSDDEVADIASYLIMQR
ncbi:MAG: cytochrome c, partial [Terriglobales bacterium]